MTAALRLASQFGPILRPLSDAVAADVEKKGWAPTLDPRPQEFQKSGTKGLHEAGFVFRGGWMCQVQRAHADVPLVKCQ